MQIITEELSIKDQDWKQYTLINDKGMEVSCLNYGGIVTKILVPDRDNTFENVVLSYRNDEDYLTNPVYLGALVGRVAGRIQGSEFELDGESYHLPANNGENHLHGGPSGFHQVIWDVEEFKGENEVGLKLSHTSPDGEGGYPGNVNMTVTYTLDNENRFSIAYEGVSDKRTPLTVTNHSYFNLSGNLKEDIKKHDVTMNSGTFVELDSELIPTGEKLTVERTAFDFRNGRKIEEGILSDHEQNKVAGNGYDHYFILDKGDIIVRDYESGRKLIVSTDEPGVVMYASTGMDDSLELTEGKSKQYLGLCLETQSSPASLHHDGFPSCIIEKDQKYVSKTVFKFGLI